MKIVFKTTIYGDDYETREEHDVIADGKCILSQMEGGEPEDNYFGRDLFSPHSCKELIELVIAALKRGEEITFEDVEVDETENDD